MIVGILVGTRPEIVKMAPVLRACIAAGHDWRLYHTGQHYSFEMDGVFFEELGLPRPHVNLEVGSGSQAYQIGAIVTGMTDVLERECPDVLLVEGDTNSVLAGGLTAHKLGIRVGHVEAGLRSYDRTMPEEINRILTDHLSDLLFAPTEHSRAILLGEKLDASRIHVTGNTVVDELLLERPRALARGAPGRLGVTPRRYAIATVHRAENTDAPARLRASSKGSRKRPRHCRSTCCVPCIRAPRSAWPRSVWRGAPACAPCRRCRYLDFLGLMADAALALTDSGGVQEEPARSACRA